jgi:hypothetical protein
MKKSFFIAMLLVSVTAGKAQDKRPPDMEEHLKRTNETLQVELQMNSTQRQKVELAFKDFSSIAAELRKKYPPPPPDPKMKAVMDQPVKERDIKIEQALTREQY